QLLHLRPERCPDCNVPSSNSGFFVTLLCRGRRDCDIARSAATSKNRAKAAGYRTQKHSRSLSIAKREYYCANSVGRQCQMPTPAASHRVALQQLRSPLPPTRAARYWLDIENDRLQTSNERRTQ